MEPNTLFSCRSIKAVEAQKGVNLFGPKKSVVEPFEHLYERELKPMLGMAYLMLGSQTEAEDVVQEAFVGLLDRFDSITNPGGYLRITVINKCNNLLKKRVNGRSLLQKIISQYKREYEQDYPEELGMLRELTPQHREVVVLRYYLGHTPTEIAEIIGVPVGTVKSRINRALSNLKGEFNG